MTHGHTTAGDAPIAHWICQKLGETDGNIEMTAFKAGVWQEMQMDRCNRLHRLCFPTIGAYGTGTGDPLLHCASSELLLVRRRQGHTMCVPVTCNEENGVIITCITANLA